MWRSCIRLDSGLLAFARECSSALLLLPTKEPHSCPWYLPVAWSSRNRLRDCSSSHSWHSMLWPDHERSTLATSDERPTLSEPM